VSGRPHLVVPIACVLLGAALAYALTASGGPPGEAPSSTRIVILHDNDIHFTVNHADRVRAAVDGVRARHEHVFLVSAGDLFTRYPGYWQGGGLEYYEAQSEAVIRRMNDLRYDAATLGNHDLYAHGEITGRSLGLARFPLLGANIDVGGAALPVPEPYTVLRTRTGISLAVVGLSIVNFSHSEVTGRDARETFAAYAHLRREHDVLVALTHLGFLKDLDLARAFSEIDVVIGGHTHTLLPTGTRMDAVLVAQTGGHVHAPSATRHMQMGEIVLVLEGRTIVEKCAYVYAIGADGPIPLASTAPDRPFGAGTCGPGAPPQPSSASGLPAVAPP
jgi:2',3'-cyclic-nucleotide 2'-phosphodiesterase (5'-nucleotidase family)